MSEALLPTSFPRRCGSAGPRLFRSALRGDGFGGAPDRSTYTRAMRRWVCIVALLAGFAAGPGARPRVRRPPVAIERLVEANRPAGGGEPDLRRTIAWWLLP